MDRATRKTRCQELAAAGLFSQKLPKTRPRSALTNGPAIPHSSSSPLLHQALLRAAEKAGTHHSKDSPSPSSSSSSDGETQEGSSSAIHEAPAKVKKEYDATSLCQQIEKILLEHDFKNFPDCAEQLNKLAKTFFKFTKVIRQSSIPAEKQAIIVFNLLSTINKAFQKAAQGNLETLITHFKDVEKQPVLALIELLQQNQEKISAVAATRPRSLSMSK